MPEAPEERSEVMGRHELSQDTAALQAAVLIQAREADRQQLKLDEQTRAAADRVRRDAQRRQSR
jgi:hypothetical protein